MAKPRSPDGCNVPVMTKLSDRAVAAMDEARGGLTRSGWLREAALEKLGARLAEVTVPGRSERPRPVPEQAPAQAWEREEPQRVNCRHPADHVQAGECQLCGADVW